MPPSLEAQLDDLEARNSKLLLLVGKTGAERSARLKQLAEARDGEVLEVGAELGRRLVPLSTKERALKVSELLSDLAQSRTRGGLLFLDRLELLFEPLLQVQPLLLLRQLARVRRVVAVWPGELKEGRLLYADPSHPEYCDTSLDGLLAFELDE